MDVLIASKKERKVSALFLRVIFVSLNRFPCIETSFSTGFYIISLARLKQLNKIVS